LRRPPWAPSAGDVRRNERRLGHCQRNGVGNATSDAYAGATNGGRAVANSNAVETGWERPKHLGRHGRRGLPLATPTPSRVARRWACGGRKRQRGCHRRGVAISDSNAYSRGGGRRGRKPVRVRGDELLRRAISDSAAVSNGWMGGRAVSLSESLADALGGTAVSQVRAISDASVYGSAHSDGVA